MESRIAIGVDVGGTKCAAGLVSFPEGQLLVRRVQQTDAARGGSAVLADVAALIAALREEAADAGGTAAAVGVGVAELVGLDGRVLSDATIAWSALPVADVLARGAGLLVRIEADVRAAARAEAALGAGRGRQSGLYVTVGTGISSCLVVHGVPYAGARGLTGTCGSAPGLIPGHAGELAAGPPLEHFASGPAIARRYCEINVDRAYETQEVIARCEAGDDAARSIVTSAGAAIGAAIAQMVNVLDPEIVVIGGGLGLVGGAFRDAIEHAMRSHIWSDLHRDVPLASAQLGVDAGVVGAALAAIESVDDSSAQVTSR